MKIILFILLIATPLILLVWLLWSTLKKSQREWGEFYKLKDRASKAHSREEVEGLHGELLEMTKKSYNKYIHTELRAVDGYLRGKHSQFKQENSQLNTLRELISGTFGLEMNANDLFMYNCAESITLSPRDLDWVLPIFEEFQWDGTYACLSFITKREVLDSYKTEKFIAALDKIKSINPTIYTEYNEI
jgi:hypothetical protein